MICLISHSLHNPIRVCTALCLYQFREFRKRDKLDKMIISTELLKRFNPNGNVSALEFLVGMLTYGDIVDKERDIDPILRKFIELDKNKKADIHTTQCNSYGFLVASEATQLYGS